MTTDQTSKTRDRRFHELTEEQVGEVQARRADRNAPTLTLTELDDRLRRLGMQLA